jgi:hypothetical protein
MGTGELGIRAMKQDSWDRTDGTARQDRTARGDGQDSTARKGNMRTEWPEHDSKDRRARTSRAGQEGWDNNGTIRTWHLGQDS